MSSEKFLAINCLHYRRSFPFLIVHFLKKIIPDQKSNIVFNFLTQPKDYEPYDWETYLDREMPDIQHKVVRFPFPPNCGINYMDKAFWMSKQPEPFMMKLDEDIFFNHYVWDFIIDTLVRNNWNNNWAFLSPALNIGIPSVELFENSFLSQEERDLLHAIYLKTNIPTNHWGSDFGRLNAFTIGAKEWDCEGFYKAVGQVNHYYKGVHPVRLNWEAQKFMQGWLLGHIQWFVDPSMMKITELHRPYYCNSCFIMPTKEYASAINTPSFAVDSFDEVTLNNYVHHTGKMMAFIAGCIAIHTQYNGSFAPPGIDIYQEEDRFYKALARAVMG